MPCYALHENQDGQEGTQEAQNAAATSALFQVQSAKSQTILSLVPACSVNGFGLDVQCMYT